MLGFLFLQSFLDQGEDVLLEGTKQFPKDFSPPTFPIEEANDSIA